MRILCIYKHYWPDIAPYGLILKNIVEHLVTDGHEVVVLTAQPTYNDVALEKQPWRETVHGVQVVRVTLMPERKRFALLRLANFVLFLARALLHAIWNRRSYDVVLFNGHPPVMMGSTGLMIRLLARIPYIYHCEDIHPESSHVAARIKGGRLYRWLRRIDTEVCRRALRVITLSDDMKNTLLERGIPSDHIEVLNNFILKTDRDDSLAVLPAPLTESEDDFNVLFAGNLGHFQGLDAVVEAAKRLAHNPKIRIVFMGEGSAKQRLVDQAGDLNGETVFFLPHYPVEVAQASMRRANLGLVTLAPDVYRVAYPCKTMMYLSVGCPVLAVVEPDSSLAKSIRDHKLGYVCASRDPDDIAATIELAWQELAGRDQQRNELRETADRLFGREPMLSRWTELLSALDVPSDVAQGAEQSSHPANNPPVQADWESCPTSTDDK